MNIGHHHHIDALQTSEESFLNFCVLKLLINNLQIYYKIYSLSTYKQDVQKISRVTIRTDDFIVKVCLHDTYFYLTQVLFAPIVRRSSFHLIKISGTYSLSNCLSVCRETNAEFVSYVNYCFPTNRCVKRIRPGTYF